MVIVEHRRNAVKTESVELEFFEPVFAVGEQEVEYFVLSVVEAQGIPCRMFAAGITVEILVVAAVEASESFHFVFNGMRMHDVHNHGNSVGMGFVDKGFQLFRCAEAAGRSIEAGNVVAERTVVGVFLNGHDLDGIVSVLHYARKNVFAEFFVSTHALFVLSHTDMAFIDEQRVGFRLEVLDFELVFSCRFPDLG